MKRGCSKALRVALLSIFGVILLTVCLLQATLNSSLVTGYVDRLAAEKIDGGLSYGRLRVSLLRHFPEISLRLDSLALTYPHSRFARFDTTLVPAPMRHAGEGSGVDTLLRFDRLELGLNLWRFVDGGRISVSRIVIHGPRLYAHSFDDSTANWHIFKPSPAAAAEKDASPDKGGGQHSLLSRLELGAFETAGRPRIVYTSLSDSLMADIRDASLSLSGGGLRASGSVSLGGDVALGLESGNIEIPLCLKTLFDFAADSPALCVKLSELDAEVAYIPVRGEALAEFGDSTYLRAALRIDECKASELLRRYATVFTPRAADIGTNARISISLDADGYLSDSRIPRVNAGLRIAPCRIYYKPQHLQATLEADIDAELSESGSLSASVNTLKALTPGLGLSLSGSGRELNGADPGVDARLKISAVLDSLMRFLPEGLDLSGILDADVNARMRLSDLSTMKFMNARLGGRIAGSRISLDMPSDSLSVDLGGASLAFNSNPGFISADICADSVMARMGSSLSARARGMENRAVLRAMRTADGRYAPRISLDNSEKSLFVRSDRARAAAFGIQLSAALQKRLAPRRPAGMRRLSGHGGDPASPVRLDSSLRRYLRQWSPEGSASIRNCMVAVPALPLRSGISHFAFRFNSGSMHLDSLHLRCGSSDLELRGRVSGLMPLLLGRGPVNFQLDADSRRINANELLSALEMGRARESDAAGTLPPSQEFDDSFVVDSLPCTDAALPDVLFMLPGRLSGKIRMNAARVEYSNLVATPFCAQMTLRDRCLQLSNTSLRTNIGQVGLDAFYATPDRHDIRAGVNLNLSEMSAEGIISMLPVVDSLMPALRSFKGKLNCELAATAQIDTNMNVITPSLDAVLDVSGHDLRIDDAGSLRKVTSLLMFRNRDIGEIRDLSASCIIHDNRLELFPFLLNVDRYVLALSGLQNFDQTMNYHVSILRSPFLMRFGINVYGTLDNWRFSLGRALYKDGVPVFSDQLDKMQSNILDYIRNIYSNPVNPGSGSITSIDARKRELGYVSGGRGDELSQAETAQIDSMMFAACEDEFDTALMDEVDAVLAGAHNDIDAVMGEHESLMFDKRIQRRIERLKRKSSLGKQ